MKRTVKLSLGMSFIMLALVMLAPHLASPKLVLRFLPEDIYEDMSTIGIDHNLDLARIIRWLENSSSKY